MVNTRDSEDRHGPRHAHLEASEAAAARGVRRLYQSPENNRAPGRTCMTACCLLKAEGRVWQEASQIDSKGCGANMRVAPIGLAPGLSDEQRAGDAQLQSALTHGHPTALAASDLTARAVHLLAQGTDPVGLVGRLRYAYDNRTRYHHTWLGDLWTRSQDPTPNASSHAVGTSAWRSWTGSRRLCAPSHRRPTRAWPPVRAGSPKRLATGLLCFLLFPDEPVIALRRAACSSGDSDSIACLTGAFAGAWLGADAWPAQWADRIEHRGELLALGELWDA
ncbi:ADP-ribosylglycohydrolase family protein [Streptomyces sp. NPDC020792]|uniref:ADP-ribosylglycohydrolase family protein n=1 Tax=Streptomyces sp. NPDC020792 TaxID=3365089 RepID=UPI003799863F